MIQIVFSYIIFIYNINQIHNYQDNNKNNNMQSKTSTDIDRKLAIYYHPLFQQIIKIIVDLFHSQSDNQMEQKFEIGLLQFVEFNLKLQKSLLPTFEVDNALISGLNDWVKEVAECLSYEGMVSTAGCVQVTPRNIMQLIGKQYDTSYIELFDKKERYLQIIGKVSHHDAFKLLGVKINKEVFSKFMFDLCSTWCQFLDVELFSYFLVGIYIQISKGQTIKDSKFKHTKQITTIDLEFMQQFEEVKSSYNKIRKKQLRYYRAWCEWNYLRVNEAGERLILKLDEIHVEDNRILQLATVFEKAIQIINEEITSQNPLKEDKQRKKQKQANKSKQESEQFLILKKLSLQPNQKQQPKNKKEQQQPGTRLEQGQRPQPVQSPGNEQQTQNYEYQGDQNSPVQDFEIEIDQQGNMFLKRIIKLPVFGKKIQPRPLDEKIFAYKQYLQRKKNEYRTVSNLYGKMQTLKVRLEHNVQNDPYTFKKNPKVQQRDKFYEQKKVSEKRIKQLQKTIHQKNVPTQSQDPKQKEREPIQIPMAQKQVKTNLRQEHDYIHKVMAPSFLTDDAYNLSYQLVKQGQIYANSANDQKRQLKIGLPKLKNMEFRVKQMKSYHIVGKLINDRSLINEKIRSVTTNIPNKKVQKSKLDNLKEENQHIWKRYISEQEMKELNNYEEFYQKLNEAKRKFGMEFQSEFRINLAPMFAYDNKRHQLGGILTKQDQQRFSVRMEKLINKQNRRNKKRARKQKFRQYRKSFKNKNQKSLYQDIFINYHKQAIKQIKLQRKRHASMIAS